MEHLESKHYLNELWSLHSSRNDRSTLMEYLEEFTRVYQSLANVNYFGHKTMDSVLDEVTSNSYFTISAEGLVELEHLPKELLQVAQRHLVMLSHLSDELELFEVRLSVYLVQALIIVSRTHSLFIQQQSTSLVGSIVMISTQILKMMKEGQPSKGKNEKLFEQFINVSLYFIECLYDPEFIWRSKIKGRTVQHPSSNVPLLNVEVIPFFFEALQTHTYELNPVLQHRLLHMFGAILSGFQKNALLATSSATLDVLMKYLSRFMQCHDEPLVEVEQSSDAKVVATESIRLVLNLVVTMVHTLHSSGPDQCQMEVKTVIVEYLNLLSETNTKSEVQLQMISFIPEILNTRDKAALQMMLLQNNCFDHLKEVLVKFRQRVGEDRTQTDEFAIHFTKIIQCLVAGSMSAKDLFSKLIGTPFLLDNYKKMCIPSKDVLLALLSMGVETPDALTNPQSIKNVFIILMLFDWLPAIEQQDEQAWLSSVLSKLFTTCTSNKIIACHCKLITRIIELLIKHEALFQNTVFNLIQLIEHLGSYSITSRQTLAFMEMLRQDSTTHQHLNKYFNVFMNSLSVMAYKDITDRKPSYFFDLQDETSGIATPPIPKWGGTGFTVHAWLCLEYFPHLKNSRKRRQLYSFSNDHGVGMEGFFTADCHLVLSVSTKKNYFTVKLNEHPFTDNKWHCIQIVHHPGRKVFGYNGVLQVFVDGFVKLSTTLRFPSLSSSFTLCHIGSSGHRTNSQPSPEAIRSFFNENNSGNTDRVVVIDNGSQDEVWGQATSLLGQLGPVAIFNDSLKEGQLLSLYRTGPDMWKSARSADSPFDDIPSNKIVLYYEAKACHRHVCKDLSCNLPPKNGRLTGHKIYTWDIKNTINCVGGVSVLMPLLDIINMRHSRSLDQDSPEPVVVEAKVTLTRSDSLISTSRIGAVKNPVANFICVLTGFVASSSHAAGWHAINAEVMVKSAITSTIGALLQKMPASLLNENLLCSIQYYAGAVAGAQVQGTPLLMDIYQYLLFDFRVWCLSDAATQYSHVQYLSILIKENKKTFRLTFGVQYLLDVIKTFYSSAVNDLTNDDTRNIRCSLLGLVKYYVTYDISSGELDAIFSFLSASNSNAVQICEVFELVKSLWHCKCNDQLSSLLSENKYATILYSFLSLPEYSDQVRVGVAEILQSLFKSYRSMEKHKNYLKQTSIGFAGVLNLMKEIKPSDQLAQMLLKVFKCTDMDGSTFINLTNLLCGSSVSIRKDLCQYFLTLAYSKTAFLHECAKQKAWQDVVTKLFVQGMNEVDSVKGREHASPHSPSLMDGQFDSQLPSVIDGSTPNDNGQVPSSLFKATLNGGNFLQDGCANEASGNSEEFVLIEQNDTKIEGDLVELAVEFVFLIMWRGVTGSNDFAWMERGQVFTCLNRVASSNDLLLDLDDIKAKLLEHCVEAALSDIRESSTNDYVKATGLTFSMANENSYELVRLIHDFLITDGLYKKTLWTEKLMQNFFALYEALAVWGLNSDVAFGTEWLELASIGLRLLCGCIEAERLELVAMASAKLHNLIHSRDPSSTEEVCYLLNALNACVCESIKKDSYVKKFVIPLVRDLLEKNFKRLQMGRYLSELPPGTGNSAFYDDFLIYCLSKEWTHFIKISVKPSAEKYMKAFNDLTVMLTVFWTATTEQFMHAYHQRERERGETKLRFKAHFESDFYKGRTAEEDRYGKNLKSLRNQNVSVLRQWRASKRFLVSERGFWKDRNPTRTYWKLSNAENFSRMRLKLTENYNFDPHQDASRLRDNLSLEQIQEKPQETIVPPSAILSSTNANKEDDNVGDEDWNMLASHPNITAAEPSAKEKSVVSKECQLVTLMDVVSGKLEVSTTHVYFYDKSSAGEEGSDSGMDFKWSLSQLREVHLRRYNLRKSALELFLIDQTNYFINFIEPNTRLVVYKALLGVRPPNLLYYGMRTPQALLKASNLTQKWIQREMSNFDYLMHLNTIAGRTYNDLSQYPVFPWVLRDYSSEKLDLEDPDVYRDFTRPVGVLNPRNEEQVRDRYNQFEDPNGVVSKFHYGSHYSNAATVLFYMLRMEPFTTLHIQLQAGRFDLADRQFHSLQAMFQNILDTSNDVKELIPEFFYMPEFLLNSNGFDLGKLQFTKETVNDVILPQWAKSAADFIFQHRRALESEHVSANLHHWIDLIFGYKQRGEEAVKAFNVFYYCTYEGAVDLDAIHDPIQRKAVEGMINNFGQIPTQLLTEPHPKRMSKEEASRKVLGSRIMSTLTVADERSPNILEQPDHLKPFFVEIMAKSDPLVFVTVPKNQSHSFIQSGMPDAMVTVSESGVIGLHGWLPYDRVMTNYFTFEKDPAVGNGKLQKSVKGHFSPGLHLSPHMFLVSHDAKYLFAAGFWDNSIRVMSLRGKAVFSLVRHLDVVTCIAQDHGGTYLMSGSYDTTCIIWKISLSSAGGGSVAGHPLHILYGHHDVVTTVVINSELDVALSSSTDGTCIMHSVRKGNYIRTILPFSNNPESFTVPAIAMSDEGKIVLYARTKKDVGEEKHLLHLYSINGQHLALDCLETRLGHMTICGEHLVTGDVRGVLIVRELFSFNEISRLQLCRPIACVYVTKLMTHILVCLRDGKLIIVGADRPAKFRSLFKSTS